MFDHAREKSIRDSFGTIAILVWPLYVNDLYLAVLWDKRLGLLWMLDVVFFTIIPAGTLCWLISTGHVTLSEMGLSFPVRFGLILLGLALAPVLGIVMFRGLGPLLSGVSGCRDIEAPGACTFQSGRGDFVESRLRRRALGTGARSCPRLLHLGPSYRVLVSKEKIAVGPDRLPHPDRSFALPECIILVSYLLLRAFEMGG